MWRFRQAPGRVWLLCVAMQLAVSAQTDSAARALSLASHGNCSEAIPELKHAAARAPSSVPLQNALGVCESRAGHANEALLHFTLVAKLQPGAWQAWNNLGANYLTLDQTAEAESA